MLPLICTVESVPVVRVKTSTVDPVPVFITCCYRCCGGVLKWVWCTVACCGGADKDDCGVGLRLPATIPGPGPPDGRVAQSLDRAVVQPLDRAVVQSLDRAVVQPWDRAVVQSLDRAVVQPLDRAVVQSLDRAVRFDNHVSTTCSVGSSGNRRFSRPIYTAR